MEDASSEFALRLPDSEMERQHTLKGHLRSAVVICALTAGAVALDYLDHSLETDV